VTAGPAGGGFQEAFARIEAAVDGGDTDLRALGFWGLVGKVKADEALSRHWADAAGRIDRTSFEARVRPRFPVWVGNAVLLVGTGAGAVAIAVALRTSSEVTAGVALLLAAGIWTTVWHDLAHWAAGRLVGIRFLAYFVAWDFPPRPGLKVDYATYLRTAPGARAWMHAAGALASKLAPFVALAFWPASAAPAWAAWALVALGVAQVALDLRYSVRSSDWMRVKRERRFARLQASNR
jgi:hypothetical protein